MTLSDALRQAVRESGLTPYAVAKAAAVPPPTLYRWLSGERDLTLATADKIAVAVRLRVLQPKGKAQ